MYAKFELHHCHTGMFEVHELWSTSLILDTIHCTIIMHSYMCYRDITE